jgi:pseudouridine synthase
MCGVASRRKADEFIEMGKVKVNGRVVKELGYSIDTEKDKIEVGARVIKPETKRYVVLNKPRLYLTTLGEGQEGKKTIEELIKDIPERVYPVGRLDYDTEGLLILTNDGEVANRILHPRYKLTKVYTALVKGKVEQLTLEKMKTGTQLEDGYVKPDYVKTIRHEEDNSFIEIAFHEGRKHIVKRFLLKFGYPVLGLRRIAIGPIQIGKLPKGKWRDLTGKELDVLREMCGLKFGRKIF